MGLDDLEIETPLFRDMHLCIEQVGISHGEFLKWPRIEKAKARWYLIIKSKKIAKDIEDLELDQKDGMTAPSDAPELQSTGR